MNSKTKLFIVGITLFTTTLPMVFAQAGDLSRSDRRFLEKAAVSGEKEVQVSRAVLPKLVQPEAKAFAEMMVADHTAANNKLKALAARKGVTLPAPETKIFEKWTQKQREVEEDYWDEMVDDHQDAVNLFEKGTKSDDPEIAAFARETLPKLQEHLAMAKARTSMMQHSGMRR